MMAFHFLYVFSEENRDALLKAGYKLMKSDKKNSVFVFADRAELQFDQVLPDATFVRSNTLTF